MKLSLEGIEDSVHLLVLGFEPVSFGNDSRRSDVSVMQVDAFWGHLQAWAVFFLRDNPDYLGQIVSNLCVFWGAFFTNIMQMHIVYGKTSRNDYSDDQCFSFTLHFNSIMRPP